MMQEEIATVVSSENGIVEVTTKIQSTCAKCEQNSHCGTGLLARYLAPRPENLILSSQLPLTPGQQIKIGFSENVLLKLAALVYLAPVVLLLLCSSVFSFLFPELAEPWLILIAFTSCGGYFLTVRSMIINGWINLGEPEITQVFSPEETPIKLHLSPK